MIFFTQVENKQILNFTWKYRRPWINKAILSNNSNAGDITIPDFKLYNRASVTKTTCYWHTKQTSRSIGYKIQIKIHTVKATLFFTKMSKIYNGGKMVSLLNGTIKTGYPYTEI